MSTPKTPYSPAAAASNSMTGMARYTVGLNNVGSYQVSSIPFITGSSGSAGDNKNLNAGAEKQFTFPFVTKALTVINTDGDTSTGGPIRVHFNSTASSDRVINGMHYVSLNSTDDSVTLNVKCKEVWISSTSAGAARSFTIIADLTQIPSSRMFTLTGSGLTD